MNISYADIAKTVWQCFQRESTLYDYPGILAMYGALRLGVITESQDVISKVLELLEPFWQAKVKQEVKGKYGENVYKYGGYATAYAVRCGYIPEAVQTMIKSANLLQEKQQKNDEGVYCMSNRRDRSNGFVWIDSVFGVCPFLLWTGLETGQEKFIDDAVYQMKMHHEILFNHDEKLYHQAYHANVPHTLTPGFWSRGMGWGMHALVDLTIDLPEDHPDFAYIRKAYLDAIEGCLLTQDHNGMWHQVMNDPGSYVETSGSGLILYALGKGIKAGILQEDKYIEAFKRGINRYISYIAFDGSIYHSCKGCCAPGYNGTISDYAVHEWVRNDHHGFGPAILALSQAEELRGGTATGEWPLQTSLVPRYGGGGN